MLSKVSSFIIKCTVQRYLEFEYARGYPVERENYIKDLLSFVRKSNVISVEKNKRN
ncbi:dual specificity phosphatase 11 (RNA/RNP complex 1-interacting) [Schistosoma japonicum]|nr:dual specificity phosphatase 11 (RNA/RNP complex 1-interacting) [Schistosoma japonicum]